MSKDYKYLSDDELQKLMDSVEQDILIKAPENLEADVLSYIDEKEKLQNELKSKKNKRFIDSEKTFEFIKKNYAFIRNDIHSRMYNCTAWQEYTPEQKAIEEHQMTVNRLWKMESKLPFLLDPVRFDKSMDWWFKNWSYRPR